MLNCWLNCKSFLDTYTKMHCKIKIFEEGAFLIWCDFVPTEKYTFVCWCSQVCLNNYCLYSIEDQENWVENGTYSSNLRVGRMHFQNSEEILEPNIGSFPKLAAEVAKYITFLFTAMAKAFMIIIKEKKPIGGKFQTRATTKKQDFF